MSDRKWTGDVWNVDPDGHDARLRLDILDDEGNVVARVHPVLGDTPTLLAPPLANARLIASSPELYEALEAAVQQLGIQRMWIKNWSPSFESEGEYIGDAELADKAIADGLAALAKADTK